MLPILNALKYKFSEFRNQTVDKETRDVRPGYDKLTPSTRTKRRENFGQHPFDSVDSVKKSDIAHSVIR